MKVFRVCWRVGRSRNIKTTTILILAMVVLSSCALMSKGELNPVEVSGCDKADLFNPCITKDTTTPNDRTAVCVGRISDGVAWRANRYLLKSTLQNNHRHSNGVFPRTGNAGGYSLCKNYTVVEGEYALTLDNGPFITISGNVCTAHPTINVYSVFAHDWQKHKRLPYSVEMYTDPLYMFYVGWRRISGLDRRYTRNKNPLDKKLLLMKELFKTQCGVFPDEIRVLGWLTVMSPQEGPITSNFTHNQKSTSEEIYRGTYYPNAPGLKVVHDDKEMGKALYDLALAREQAIQSRILAARKQANERLNKAKIGGAMLFGLLFGMHAASPCNDPGLSEAEKPYYCN